MNKGIEKFNIILISAANQLYKSFDSDKFCLNIKELKQMFNAFINLSTIGQILHILTCDLNEIYELLDWLSKDEIFLPDRSYYKISLDDTLF